MSDHKNHAARRVLEVRRRPRLGARGRPLGVDEIFERAWHGEQATHESARRRVYVAISTLRELGLRDVLLHDLDGYLLDPAIPTALGP